MKCYEILIQTQNAGDETSFLTTTSGCEASLAIWDSGRIPNFKNLSEPTPQNVFGYMMDLTFAEFLSVDHLVFSQVHGGQPLQHMPPMPQPMPQGMPQPMPQAMPPVTAHSPVPMPMQPMQPMQPLPMQPAAQPLQAQFGLPSYAASWWNLIRSPVDHPNSLTVLQL